jgi:hypothetical protein
LSISYLKNTAKMKMNLFDLISAKLELWRLEQKYTKRRNRRSTFVSDAVYVDGEYIYAMPPAATLPSPSPSGSARSPTVSNGSPGTSKRHSTAVDFGAMATGGPGPSGSSESVAHGISGKDGIGSSGEEEARKGRRARGRWSTARLEKRRSMFAPRDVRWEDSRP